MIPWGIDLKSEASDASNRDIDILGAGSFIPLKQYDVFIDVIELIAKKIPELNVVILGEGPSFHLLEKRVVQNKLSDIISFPGLLKRHKVHQFMSRSKVFLHTSSYESQGYVLYESIAKNCSVVSTPVGVAEKPTARWKISNETNQLAQHCIDFLLDNESNNLEQGTIPSIEETSLLYKELYFRLKPGKE